jgi:hypothetical protein
MWGGYRLAKGTYSLFLPPKEPSLPSKLPGWGRDQVGKVWTPGPVHTHLGLGLSPFPVTSL